MPEARQQRRRDDRPFESLPKIVRPLLLYVGLIAVLLFALIFIGKDRHDRLIGVTAATSALLLSGAFFLYSRFSSRQQQTTQALLSTSLLAIAGTVTGFGLFSAHLASDYDAGGYQPPIKVFANGTAWVKIFFATDRYQKHSSIPNFGPERSDGHLTYGHITVSVPRDHRLTRIERPSIWRLEFTENPSKHFVLADGGVTPETDFYGEVSKLIGTSTQKQAFIFIHGFNVSFEDAVYRTAQIAYDLGFDGVPILYSWPSNGQIQDYTWDSTANDWTVPHLRAFLEDFATKSGAKTVHVIAHSMGNRALVNALAGMSKPKSPRFREVILTAPDIDAGIFMQLADAMKPQTSHLTLYASSNDQALKASKKINGGRRAGDTDGGVLVVDGIDSIDVSAIDTNLIGHFYYAENRSVLSDIFELFVYGSHPPRFGLRPAGTPPGKYWVFAP